MTALTRPRAAGISAVGRMLRNIFRLAGWIVVGFCVGIALALALPFAFDARPLTVLSGSMEPQLHVGDIAIVQRIEPLDARTGDIVTFQDPAHPRLITHRVRNMQVKGDQVIFTTRGDANNLSERWQVRKSGEISRTMYTVPKLGHVLIYARNSGILAIGFGVLLAALLVLELGAIWRDDDEDASAEEAGDEALA